MNWRDVPSLPALRAFEAAARVGSFSAAARELNVTHAAIAQHVRTVEAHLGASLLVREGRGMVLTDVGQKLAASLSDGFGQIIAGVRAVTEDAEARPLAISVTPSFAENWLMPRLARFWVEHPGLTLSITPSMKLVDLHRDGFDMAIRYGDGKWPGLDVTSLTSANYVVVAAPSLVQDRTVTSFADLHDLPWLFEVIHREPRKWAEESGLDFACCQVNELPTLSMILSAVRAGGGVSIISSALVADDIATGRLVDLLQGDSDDLAYHIVTRTGVLSPRLKIFRNWLLRNA